MHVPLYNSIYLQIITTRRQYPQSLSRPEEESLERSSKLGLLKAKQESKNQAGVGVSHRLPSAGMWLYLQNEHYLYLQDCCRVQPKSVSHKQIVGAQRLPVVILTGPIWVDKASGGLKDKAVLQCKK